MLGLLAVLGALSYALFDHGVPSRPLLMKPDALPLPAKATPTLDPCDATPSTIPTGVPGRRLRCLEIGRRLAPTRSVALAWDLASVSRRGVVTGRDNYLVAWTGSRGGYAVWRREKSGWRRLLLRLSESSYSMPSVSLDDVTQDGRTDALVQATAGSGGCGHRHLLRIGQRGVRTLFDRQECEVYSDLRDGLLYFRTPLSGCGVHCLRGVGILIRGWSGDRVVLERRIVRCRQPGFDPERACRPR